MLPSARRAYDSALKGFEAGKVGYLQVLDAQRTRSQAELGYLSTLTNAYRPGPISTASSDADSHYAMTMQILRFPLAAPARSLTVALLAAASLLAATGAAADESPAPPATPTTRQPKGPARRRPDPRRRQRRRTAGQRIRRFLTPAPVGLRRLQARRDGRDQTRVRVLRPNGVVEELRLEPSDGALVSTQDIAEPHYFEIEAEVNWPGRSIRSRRRWKRTKA